MLTPRLEIRSPTPASRFRFLTVPGDPGSGPEHWQTLWEREDPSFTRIEQEDAVAIETAVRGAEKPVVFVAHDSGVAAVAHWAQRFGADGVAGAFLVAPREPGEPPLGPLPFPSMLVGSEDDPHCAADRARELANAWGASFVSAGKRGHIDSAWPEGRRLLNAFATQLKFG